MKCVGGGGSGETEKELKSDFGGASGSVRLRHNARRGACVRISF